MGTAGVEHGAAADVARLEAEWGRRRGGGLGQANSTVSRNERCEELEIPIGCRSVDGVDIDSVDGSVVSVAVLE